MSDRGNSSTVRRIPNGPQILCRECGEVCNHATLLCAKHRRPDIICTRGGDGLTDADRAYLEWKNSR
jgi:hypothetical protein